MQRHPGTSSFAASCWQRSPRRWRPLLFSAGLTLAWPGTFWGSGRARAEDGTPASAPPSAQPAAASPEAEDAWGADDAVGFSASSAPPAEPRAPGEPEPAAAEPSEWVLSGFQRLVLGMWVQRVRSNPLASARQALQLDLAYNHSFLLGAMSGSVRLHTVSQVWYDFAYQYQRSSYDKPLLETYEWGLLPREIEASLTLGPVQLAVGRQIVNWGQGEVLDLLDRINPRDLREPGLTPPDEMRVPVAMTRAALTLGRNRLQAIVVHETSFGLLPPPLAPFSPLRALLLKTPVLGSTLDDKELRYRHTPDPQLFRLASQQYHGRWAYGGRGFDVALHAASLLEPLGIPVLPSAAEFARTNLYIPLVHPRYTMLGFSSAVPVARLLLRFEGAVSLQRPTALRRAQTNLLEISSARYDQLDGLAGITYVISGLTTAGLEVAQSYLLHNPERMSAPKWETLWPVEATRAALRIDHAMLDERLRVGLVGLLIGVAELNAWMARCEVSYAMSDAAIVRLQYITYHGTDRFGTLYGFTRNDRLSLTVQWNFST